jgi:ATP-dependent helicase HepA
MPTFSPGQRWISDTETDLGLGTILKVESRLITIVYMASGETRTYSAETAPLTRVLFANGDRIRSADNQEIIVSDTETVDGLVVYYGIAENGDHVTLSETQLDNFTQFNRPSDKLLNAQFDRERRYHIRLKSREMQQELLRSSVFGLCGARVDLIPHQLYIANEVANRHQPRVLLADEVGLGKTIEAGLIIHKQLTRGLINRVLIVVPEPLLHQWLVEMRRRFNLNFSIMDDELYEESLASATEGNPFLNRQLILTSLSFLSTHAEAQQHAIDASWDTMIVDEAHHIELPEGDANSDASAQAYYCVSALADSIPSVLLLTATPEQLGHSGHFARLQLLDRNRFPSLEQFSEEEQRYRELAGLATTLLAEEPLTDSQNKQLQALDLDNSLDLDNAQACVDAMIDLHGTGRVMFRNTRSAVSGFPAREAQFFALQSGGLNDWLADTIRELAPAKLLLICETIDKVETLADELRGKHGIHAAVFHEDMSIVDRDRAAEYFADDETGSQILLCSEIGSEGRNFQFLHHLILFDLPENADLLEQRIGRVDRIGQTQTINILIPYETGSKADFLQNWYHVGLDAFEHTCQIGEAVRRELAEPFQQALDGKLADTNSLIDQATVLATAKLEQIQQGRDRLLEMSSHRADRSAVIIDEIDQYDTNPGLQRYMDQALDNLGVDIEDQSAHTFIIAPGEHLAVSEYPGLPEDGTTITYRRHIALAREEVQFLTWEHPLVQTAIEQIISGGFGQVLVGAMQHESLTRGSVLIEAHYVFDCPAPKSLGVEQYLNGELLRVVLSESMQNLTDQFSHEMLNEAFHSIKKPLAKQLVSVKRAQLQAQLNEAERVANASLDDLKSQATENANTILGSEIERLEALALRNSSVRRDEIEGMRNRLDETLRALTQLRCVLDAVRVFGIA